jgi:hypothetical protein
VHTFNTRGGGLTVEAWDDGKLVGTTTLGLVVAKAFVNFEAGSATNKIETAAGTNVAALVASAASMTKAARC